MSLVGVRLLSLLLLLVVVLRGAEKAAIWLCWSSTLALLRPSGGRAMRGVFCLLWSRQVMGGGFCEGAACACPVLTETVWTALQDVEASYKRQPLQPQALVASVSPDDFPSAAAKLFESIGFQSTFRVDGGEQRPFVRMQMPWGSLSHAM